MRRSGSILRLLFVAAVLLIQNPTVSKPTVSAPAWQQVQSTGKQGGLKLRVAESYGKLPLSFEANRGQTDAQVKFIARGSGYSLFLTPQGGVERG